MDRDTLYDLLPAHVRLRDQRSGRPLEALMNVIGEQARVLDRDIDRMYDGWFIETCDDWLACYIGELVGLDPARGSLGAVDAPDSPERARWLPASRRATANAIALRRRKGTLWILEEIARDLVHWQARAVEFYCRLVTSVHVDHLRPERAATLDLRSARGLLDLDTPFDGSCRTVDVRRITSDQSRGLHNVPGVALFVWRLRAFPVIETPAYRRDDVGPHLFNLSALGNDAPLFRKPEPELLRSDIAREENLSAPLSRWHIEQDTVPAGAARVSPAVYGPDKSLAIRAPGWPKADAEGVIGPERVIPADLSDWRCRVPRNHVAIDPVLGRIAFPATQPPRNGVFATYHYGFAAELGGGAYRRPAVDLPDGMDRCAVWPSDSRTTDRFTSIAVAIEAWRRTHPLPRKKGDRTSPGLLVELMQNGIYRGRFDLVVGAGETIAIVAAPGVRPVVWLPDEGAGAADAIAITGFGGGRVVIDGLLVAGGSLSIAVPPVEETVPDGTDGAPVVPLCEVALTHSTLVPGGALHSNCDPKRPSEPSIVIEGSEACLRVASSIIGAIQVNSDRAEHAPTPIVIRDSIVDATSDDRVAIGGGVGQIGFADVTVTRATVVGRVSINSLRHALDSIFTGPIETARRQSGGLEHCYVPPGSRTPRRYRCQPDLALAVRRDGTGDATVRRKTAGAAEASRVAPRFESVRYGHPNYLRLVAWGPREIACGARDEEEMGVYHDLFEQRRLQVLTGWLQDFVPAGSDAAVIFST